jgi:3-oxoacyl-[acyl-carrier protein] reductase
MIKFVNKTVIITGSSRGLGRAIAIAFAEKDANVVLNYKQDKESADEVYNYIKKYNKNVVVIKADVTKRNDVKRLFDKTINKFGSIDVLINNAGINKRGYFDEITDNDWDMIMDSNLKSVFICCQEVFKYMKKSGGRIVNISSGAGQYHGPKTVHYAVSKAGVNSLTKVIARYGAKNNILVNAIAPGIIFTDQTKDEINSSAGKTYLEMTLLNRFGELKDVTTTCVFLASEDQNYITGQVISVSGGAYLG